VSFSFHRFPRVADIPVTVSITSYDGRKLFEGQNTVTPSPFYPNGYECDKNHPCYTAKAIFELPDPLGDS